ncbi:MAG: phosphorylase [Clostridiales bacterium]|nr:phosphorylase [Clostridiales bacterium]
MIIDCYDVETDPIIHLRDFYGEQKHIVDTCMILFSKEIYEHLLCTYKCEEIAQFNACNGKIPIYKLLYKDTYIAFYLSMIGSAMASTLCCEANWLIGATKFIMFGSCGSLNKGQTEGKFIIPTESYRGEGCSYYFAKPKDYIQIKNSHKLAKLFGEMRVPYVLGKVWTTDSMIRETVGLVAKRKAEGCIAVEMELAGVQAVCDFYNFQLYNFLESGDVVMASGYEYEGLHNANHNLGKLYIALEIAKRI